MRRIGNDLDRYISDGTRGPNIERGEEKESHDAQEVISIIGPDPTGTGEPTSRKRERFAIDCAVRHASPVPCERTTSALEVKPCH
jgi:hypothetical protein